MSRRPAFLRRTQATGYRLRLSVTKLTHRVSGL